ncbi:uncharacterized protein LOC111639963 isoform X1 [Centruroides sculpturatus]|uniref:uncharacterized protein LOC111639963 isoform X1 n=2 Tax=Centruroides sculpturatus TaxID=218467 RepID=UPI000C6D65E6|nr:uncharacterized protein LOC111639963 isoform X1 [Centruroides sculpturatus]
MISEILHSQSKLILVGMSKEECVAAVIAVSLIGMIGGQTLNNELYFSRLHPIQRRVTEHEAAVMDVCGSTQSFEKMGVAVNQQLQQVTVHPDTWVFVTRCTAVGKPCRGVKDNMNSVCRPKKSWVQVYGRSDGDSWQPHWVAVDTACVCSLQLKPSAKLQFLP